jgi:hypothetical protein
MYKEAVESEKKFLEKVAKGGLHIETMYIEYSVMEKFGGNIKFMIWSGSLIPRTSSPF